FVGLRPPPSPPLFPYTTLFRSGRIGQKESSMALDGDVRLAASDGLTVKTGHATYATSDETVRAPGPVEFARNRMQGTGTGSARIDRKSTRLNSSHVEISYAVFC